MSEKRTEMSDIVKALTDFGKIIVDDRKEVNQKFDKLTVAVESLTLSHVETKKDNEHINNKIDNLDQIQRAQGKKLNATSETVLLLDERLKNNKERWTNQDKIKISVLTAVLIMGVTAIIKLL